MNDPRKLRRFLLYTFRQRFGKEGEELGAELPLTARETNGHSHVPLPDSQLDIVINWYLGQPISEKLLQAYLYIISKTSSLPCVRRGTISTVLTWLGKRNAEINSDIVFPSVKTFLVTALMDVWSAIRKASALELTKLAVHLNAANVEDLFRQLSQICQEDSQSWQAKDGAILGISALLKCIAAKTKNSSQQQAQGPPDYMHGLVPQVVFSLVSHPQLSIRETAALVLSTYVSYVDRQEAISTLEKVTVQLSGSDVQDHSQFVDAYQAESLIDITALILKGLPLAAVLPHWARVRAALVRNLGHPASSVRQACSSVCLQLVDKGQGNPAVLTLVLQSLVESLDKSRNSSSTSETSSSGWEAVEGRMFVFESVCQSLVRDHWNRHFSLHPSSKARDREDLWLRSVQALSGGGKGRATPPCPPRLQSCLSEFPSLSLLHRVAAVDKLQSDTESQSTQQWLLGTCFDGDSGVPEWVGETTFMQGRQLLSSMLACSVECWGDNQWELRRIAQQVLPRLGEAMRWYEAEWAAQQWQNALRQGGELQACVGLCLLRDWLQQASSLYSMLQSPATPWRDDLYSASFAEKIISTAAVQVKSSLKDIERLLGRAAADRISVLAAEVLLLARHVQPDASALTNGDAGDCEETGSPADPVLGFWQQVFAAAHPGNQITTSLLAAPPLAFSFPGHGYLSCCVVGTEERGQIARQVEKTLVSAVAHLLPPHLLLLPLPALCSYLPLLAHSTGLYHADSDVCPALLHSLKVAARRAATGVVELADRGTHLPLLLSVLVTLRELAAVVAMKSDTCGSKSLEVGKLEGVLEVYLLLSCLVMPQHHLPVLVSAATARLQQDGCHPVKLAALGDPEPADLWNPDGCAALKSLGDQAVCLEQEEELLNGSLNESLSPRSPNRRNSTTCLPPPPAASIIKKSGDEKDDEDDEDDDDDGSDWDSEDDEEENEESSGMKTKLKEFFQKMIGSLGPESFEAALQSSQHPGRSWLEELVEILDLDLDT